MNLLLPLVCQFKYSPNILHSFATLVLRLRTLKGTWWKVLDQEWGLGLLTLYVR